MNCVLWECIVPFLFLDLLLPLAARVILSHCLFNNLPCLLSGCCVVVPAQKTVMAVIFVVSAGSVMLELKGLRWKKGLELESQGNVRSF